MADELTPGANDNTGAPSGGDAQAPENTGAKTLLGGDPNAAPQGGDQKGDAPGKTDQPAGAPEEYADFTFPEGVEIDKGMLDGAKAKFKEAGYSQEQAQKAIDLYLQNISEQDDAFMQTRKEWVEEIKADKDFGGDKFDVTVREATNALRKFDTDGKMVELLETSGFGDHPGVIRFLARVSKALGEDDVHGTREKIGNEPPLHERLYGKDGMGPNSSE